MLAGRDVLLVMPTGSGKSAVYQPATLVQGGPAVVVLVEAGGLLDPAD